MPEKDERERRIGKSELHQRNVLRLVKALLLLANPKADLKLENSQLTTAVKVEWVPDAENRLRVTGEYKEKSRIGKEKLKKGTTKQALWQLVEKTGNSLELPLRQDEKSSRTLRERQDDVVQDIFQYLKTLGVWEDGRPENKRNTPYWIFTLTLKHKDALLEENLGVVKQELGLETLPSTDKSIDWRDICRAMLEKQKQLTTNRLMRADEMLFDIDRIRVDLALVERKQTDKRSGDDNPERSHLYKPDYEETQKLEYEDFLTKVLKSEQSKKLAIIGEPGAGKTTLLQRIAFWILDNTDDLPIWIPLGNFPNPAPKFKDYLLNDWLEDAFP
jgi:flagellar biosynthesis GTPase FlhF